MEELPKRIWFWTCAGCRSQNATPLPPGRKGGEVVMVRCVFCPEVSEHVVRPDRIALERRQAGWTQDPKKPSQ